jgi:hypothetical protein
MSEIWAWKRDPDLMTTPILVKGERIFGKNIWLQNATKPFQISQLK